ncbi:hypothetical protein M1P56_21410 [Streptomyces sp. HU2014]|uniref:hypothetical protein n=1 Tax=Streptomyces sp. HU2014 TaxID=2939414 RepID=UPI00200EAF4C|nr:hypothetical protein [Streptomyces sp. HU2014]UQI46725.1 hypothetical protein M1P56_21410 [Streptomyces sp. HU2014]
MDGIDNAMPEGVDDEQEAPSPSGRSVPAGESDDDVGNDLDPEALRAELTAARDEAARYRAKAQETADVLKAAKTPEEFAAVQARAEELERDLQRERLGRKYSLPEVFAALITGADDEAREAHAKDLAAAFHQRPTGTRVGRGGLDPTQEPAGTSPAALAAAIPRGRH